MIYHIDLTDDELDTLIRALVYAKEYLCLRGATVLSHTLAQLRTPEATDDEKDSVDYGIVLDFEPRAVTKQTKP